MEKNNFREYNQEQLFWANINLDKLLKDDHPARIVNKIIEMLDLESIYNYYSNEGNPSYHPKMMLKILFYGYYCGRMSCRKMWDDVKYKADFIFLSAGQVPNFRTINKFRRIHLKVLPDIFTQIVFLCVKLDMIGFQYLAIDGQSIQASANRHKSRSMAELKKKYEKTKRGLAHLLEKEINEDFTFDQKEKIKNKIEKKLQKLKEWQKRLQKLASAEIAAEKNGEKRKDGSTRKGRRKAKLPEDRKFNLTDEDSNLMQHKDYRILPSYNNQSAVDSLFGVICSIDTKMRTDHAEDLIPLLEEASKNTNGTFVNILADAGFGDYDNYEKFENKQKENFYVPDSKFQATKNNVLPKGKYNQNNFIRKQDKKVICPDNHPMRFRSLIKAKGKNNSNMLHEYKGTYCNECKNHDLCTKTKFRIVTIDMREKYRIKMREKLLSDKGREIYAKRKWIVEAVHGDDQKNRGWIQHHLRGFWKAKAEFTLMRIGSNLRKIVKYKGNEILLMT